MLDEKRQALLSKMQMAFQPIVSGDGRTCYGFEALLANVQMLEYASVSDLLDEVERESFLFPFVLEMIKLVLKKAGQLPAELRRTIFINLDNRIFSHPEILWNDAPDILSQYHLEGSQVCFEISEQNRFSYAQLKRSQKIWKDQGIALALDDFGTGISGLELLYNSDPQYLKIDRFLIREIHQDEKKQKIVQFVLAMCDNLEIIPVAEGVESAGERDFLVDCGVQFFQGFFFQRPTTDLNALQKQWKVNAE